MEPTDPDAKVPMLRSGFFLKQVPPTNLQDFQTPLEHLFNVSHMGISALDKDQWTLSVGGLVKHPQKFNWEQLCQFPSHSVMATHECAGSPLNPTLPVRRVGNVVWQGILLQHLLEEVGVLPETRFMWSTGADWGEFNQLQHNTYQKDLPFSIIQNSEVILATHINGVPLTQERGAPLRLVVPDFYGTNSTKWLTGLEFCAHRSTTYFASQLYNAEIEGAPHPVWALAPHSIFVSFKDGQQLAAGTHLIWGWAWSAGGIAQVEVSVDNCATWLDADVEPRKQYSWQKFHIPWLATPGDHTIVCRASANDGQVQPKSGARNEWQMIKVHVV